MKNAKNNPPSEGFSFDINKLIRFYFVIYTETLKITNMAKKIKCKLILHGLTREISGGNFESISAAKKWIRQCWNRPYTIVPIKTPK